MKRLILASALLASGCAKVWDASPTMGGVRTWHDVERQVTCWVAGSTGSGYGLAISCLPDSYLASEVKP